MIRLETTGADPKPLDEIIDDHLRRVPDGRLARALERHESQRDGRRERLVQTVQQLAADPNPRVVRMLEQLDQDHRRQTARTEGLLRREADLAGGEQSVERRVAALERQAVGLLSLIAGLSDLDAGRAEIAAEHRRMIATLEAAQTTTDGSLGTITETVLALGRTIADLAARVEAIERRLTMSN